MSASSTAPGSRGRLGVVWQRVRTVPGLGRDVGVLVVLLILGVVAATVILSQLAFTPPWASRDVIKVEFENAVAVSPGNGQEVRIAGVEVGLITDAEPTPQGTSLLTLELEPGHPIYDNARAVLRPVNPLNQMYVTLDPGGPPGGQLPTEGVIPATQTERPVQADEILTKLDERSRVALTSLLSESDNALATADRTLPAGLDATRTTLERLRPVAQKLQRREENIRRLSSSLSRVSTALGGNDERLRSLVTSTQQTLGVLVERDDDLTRSLQLLPGATGKVREALSSLGGVTEQLEPTLRNVDQAADTLPDALDSLTGAAEKLQDVAASAKPAVADAKPVVRDLRPVVGNLKGSFSDLRPVTKCLDDATSKIAPWTYDLGAFFYNTNSLFSVSDGNGGWGRGHATVNPTAPLGDEGPNAPETNTYQQGGSPLGPYPAIGSGSCQ